MTLKNSLLVLSAILGVIGFSGCYAHNSYHATSYDYYEPAYVEEVYVESPVVYRSYGHYHSGGHCY